MSKVLQYPELRVNPFGDRICKVFSSSNDGDLTFEDFLDMMSVFSDAAPRAVKAELAFRIFGECVARIFGQFLCGPVCLLECIALDILNVLISLTDFDGDDMLGISDLKQVIERLIGEDNRINDNDMTQLIQNILSEADLDDDHALSFPEFEQ